MKEALIFYIKILCLIVYLALVIGIEPIYRQILFDKSLEWIEEFRIDKSNSSESFFKLITNFGEGEGLIPLLGIMIVWFPLNKSFAFLAVFIYAYYFDNVMKVIYGNPRPFWVKPSLFVSCNGGYGNPSGHAFSSASVYLAFWHNITDFKWFKETNAGIITRILLLILAFATIITVIFSRIYLAAHSVNQVLYGGLLGFGLYLTIFHIFSYHSMDAQTFFSYFRKKTNNLLFAVWYIILLIFGFLCWGLIDNNNELYEEFLLDTCPSVQEYRKFNFNGLFGSLSLCGIIGGHYGLVLLVYLIDKKLKGKEEEILYWNYTGLLHTLYKILLGIAFGLPLILIFAISNNSSLGVIYIFKVSFPYLVGLFNLYGPYVYVSILLKVANQNIYKDNNEPQSIPVENLGQSQNSNIVIFPNQK